MRILNSIFLNANELGVSTGISDDQGQAHGVYCRKIKNKLGIVTHEKFEPRLKRDGLKQSLSLGQYDTHSEAKTVHEIATFFYDNNQFGRLDFEDGRCSRVEPGPDEDGSRYFVISPLTENKEGKEKATLVSRKAKEVYKQFKKEQAEYRDRQERWVASFLMGVFDNEVPRRDDVVNVEGHVNAHLEARPLDLTNSQLQQASHNDQVSNSAVGAIMLDNSGVFSNTASHLHGCFGSINPASHAAGTSEPTSFDATNYCLHLSGRHEMLGSLREGEPTLSGDDSQRAELPGSHITTSEAEAGPSTVPGLYPNSTPASGVNFNIGSQFLQQLFNSLQQEKQEFQEEKQEFQQEKQEFQQEKQEFQQEKEELRQEKQELRQDKQELKRKKQRKKQES